MRIDLPGFRVDGGKLAPSFTHAKEIALLMGQLAYEGDWGRGTAIQIRTLRGVGETVT